MTPSSSVLGLLRPSVFPTEPPNEETGGGFQSVLVTVLGSGLMGIIILLGLALMLFFVIWAIQRHRKKRRRQAVSASDERTLQNPLYAKSQGIILLVYGKFVLTTLFVSDSAGSQLHELQNGTQEKTSTLPSGASPAPSYAAPPIPTIRKDGSVQYDEPILPTKTVPPVAPKPKRPTLSPLTSPHYHTLDPQTSPHLSSPTHFVNSFPSSPSSPKYHSLEPNDAHSPQLSPRSSPRGSPHFPTTTTTFFPPSSSSAGPTSSLDRRISPSLSPFASLDHRLPAHTREFSASSERLLIQSPHEDPGYDIIQPPRWERMTSTTSSVSGLHSLTRSRTSSRATLCDEEPSAHVYHELTSEGVKRHIAITHTIALLQAIVSAASSIWSVNEAVRLNKHMQGHMHTFTLYL